MSQLNTGVVLKGQPGVGPVPTIDAGPGYRPVMSDFRASMIMNSSYGMMGHQIGFGIPSGSGMWADSMASDYYKTNVEDGLKAYNKDYPTSWDGKSAREYLDYVYSKRPDLKELADSMGRDFSDAQDANEARDALAYTYAQHAASEDYRTPLESLSSPLVGMATLASDIIGDPTNWLGIGLSKLAVEKATTKLVGKALAMQVGQTAIEGAGTNAVQNYMLSVVNQQDASRLFGVAPLDDQDTMAAIAGGVFGAALPVGMASAIWGGSKAISSAKNKAAAYLVKDIARQANVPAPKTADISHLTTLEKAHAKANLIAGSYVHLYSDVQGTPGHGLELALEHNFWDEVQPSGVTPEMYADWLLKNKPSPAEAGAFLSDLMDMAEYNRQVAANGGMHPAVNKVHKDLQDTVHKIDNAFVELEDPVLARRGSAWFLSEVTKALGAGGQHAADQIPVMAMDILSMVAQAAAYADMGTDEWIVRNIKNFTLDKDPKTGETLLNLGRKTVSAVTFSPLDGRAIIRAYTGATNFRSMVHELAHIFRRNLSEEDIIKANQWVGATDGKWTTAQEEKFARGFEKYLRNRETPPPSRLNPSGYGIEGVWARMKNAMLNVYKTIKGSELDHVRLSPEIEQVFENLMNKNTGSVDLGDVGLKLVPKTGLGRIKLRISGDIERALFGLHKTKSRSDRLGLMMYLREKTGLTDNQILTASAYLYQDIRTSIKQAKKDLRKTTRPANVRVSSHGTPYTEIDIGPDYWKMLHDPENPKRFKERFADLNRTTTIANLTKRLGDLRIEREAADTGISDIEEAKKIRQKTSKVLRRLERAVKEFFPQSTNKVAGAAVVEEIESGVVELSGGQHLDGLNTSKVLADAHRKGDLDGNWLVFNANKAVKLLRKVGNVFSAGHIETVGSSNPLVAKLARVISGSQLYTDAFGKTKFVGQSLEGRYKRMYARGGQAVSEINRVLKDYVAGTHEEIYRRAMALANDVSSGHTPNPELDAAAAKVATILKKLFDDIGIRGVKSGYFRNVLDNYAGTFHIRGDKRRPRELAEALYQVWREQFTKDDAPIHRRTWSAMTRTDVYLGDTGPVQPKVLGDLTPTDRVEYLRMLLDDTIRDNIPVGGLRREAMLVANNKLGFTELKELIAEDSMGFVHSDPSLSRQINVEVWFDPRVSGFVNWNPYTSVLHYAQRTGYRVSEKEGINLFMKQLLGYDRRDVDAVGLIEGARDLMLRDPDLLESDRRVVEQSFKYLMNQVIALRGHTTSDFSRQGGALASLANVTMNLARVPVSSRTGLASAFTEIVPMLLATAVRQPKNLGKIITGTLKGMSKWQLKGLQAGYLHMQNHVPDVISSVAHLDTVNHTWLDKTFVNPWKALKASTSAPDGTHSRLGHVLTAGTSMLHRMASGLGGEDFFQGFASNVAVLSTMFRIGDSMDKIVKTANLLKTHVGDLNPETFKPIARDGGFGDDPSWAAKLWQGGLMEREFLEDMDFFNQKTGGAFYTHEDGPMNLELAERVIAQNPDRAIRLQKSYDVLLEFLENDLRSYITTPGVQDVNVPQGGADPVTRMFNMFMSYQRSWFHHVMLNNIANAKTLYGLSYLGTILLGEALYYNSYRMLYKGDSIEDLESEWEENPGIMTVQAMARSNVLGSASSIGQMVIDTLAADYVPRGAHASLYSVKSTYDSFASAVRILKASLDDEKPIDLKDARKIENTVPGINAFWMKGIMRATGYTSWSDWIFGEDMGTE